MYCAGEYKLHFRFGGQLDEALTCFRCVMVELQEFLITSNIGTADPASSVIYDVSG
jgi:hypothetical protein